jgi:hypothetical protein
MEALQYQLFLLLRICLQLLVQETNILKLQEMNVFLPLPRRVNHYLGKERQSANLISFWDDPVPENMLSSSYSGIRLQISTPQIPKFENRSNTSILVSFQYLAILICIVKNI